LLKSKAQLLSITQQSSLWKNWKPAHFTSGNNDIKEILKKINPKAEYRRKGWVNTA